MTMKKRFLGLALAAMVAVPATSAYADTITMTENETKNHEVTVTGTVKSSEGIAPEGTIEVELPTSMQFTVDQSGNFSGTTYTVTNKSKVGIDVSLASFSEGDKSGGITVIPMDTENFDSKTRDNVALKLVGDKTNAIDLANFGKSGATADNSKLLTVQANNGVGTITLTGKAGKAAASSRTQSTVDQNGVQENFNIVFQIKKENK